MTSCSWSCAFADDGDTEGGRKGAFAAMFCSEGLKADPEAFSESGSTGVGRSDSGRFLSAGLRGLAGGTVTGVGESEGSFSSFSTSSSLNSSAG